MAEAWRAELIAENRGIRDFDKFITGVMSDEIVVSRWVRQAVERHLNDLEREGFPFYFDRNKADAAIDVFPRLFRHTVGTYADSPFKLEPWQAFIIGSLFGWRNDNGKRRYRNAYITLARKQGKSTLAASVALLFAGLDGESQAQIYLAATKRDQAKLVYDEAERMIRKSPFLSKITRPMRAEIQFPQTSSYIKTLCSDKAFDGLNPHLVVLDELHAYKEIHRPFYNTITTGSAARSQPLELTITTAGDTKSAIWKEKDSYGERVVSGEITDESMFCFIARLDSKEELFDERAWQKAMPNLGVSVDIDYIRQQAKEAQSSPVALNKFARYFGNIEVSSLEQIYNVEEWDQCQGTLSSFSHADAVATGIDAGGFNDLFAVIDVAKFPNGFDENGQQDWRYECRCFTYMDADTKRDLTEQPWQSWVYLEDLKVCHSVYNTVYQETKDRMWRDYIRQVGFDPFNMQQMGEALQAEGFEAVKIPQNRYNYHEPMQLLLNLIKTKKITHDGHPVLRFALTNLVSNVDSTGRWMPDRKNSKEKIDPAVALLMALRLASLSKPKPQGALFVG